jgi:hypothetical protein
MIVMVKVGCFIVLFPIIGLVLFYLTTFIVMAIMFVFFSGFTETMDSLTLMPFIGLFSVMTSLYITVNILKDDKTNSIDKS